MPFLALFGSTISRYIAAAIALLLVLIGLYIFYLKYQNLKAENELIRFNNTQLTSTLAEKEIFIQKLQQVEQKKTEIIKDLNNQKEDLDKSETVIIKEIEKHTPEERNKGASNILKNTVKKLQEEQNKRGLK